MNWPGEHYAKWNKPVRERKVPYDLTHMESNEQTKLTSNMVTVGIFKISLYFSQTRISEAWFENKFKVSCQLRE